MQTDVPIILDDFFLFQFLDYLTEGRPPGQRTSLSHAASSKKKKTCVNVFACLFQAKGKTTRSNIAHDSHVRRHVVFACGEWKRLWPL